MPPQQVTPCLPSANSRMNPALKELNAVGLTEQTNNYTAWLKKKKNVGSSHCGTVEMNPTRNHEVVSSIPGFTQWVKDPAFL